MNDVWFGTDLTHRDVETVVQALSLQGDRLPPLIAIGDRGARLVLASRIFFRFFEVTDGEALAARLLGGRDPGARRLSVLCQNLAINGAPRLERLRCSLGPASEVITFLCRRVLSEDQQPIFVAAALGLRADHIAVDPDVPQAAEQLVAASSPAADPVMVQAVATAESPLPVKAPANGPLPQEAMTVQAIQATLRTRWPANRSIRFLWQTDADLVCTQLTPPLADVVGVANAGLVGQNLLDLAPRIDPSGRLAEALASKSTWSGVDVAWPIDGSRAAVEVGLGAIPAYVRDQTFEGFRGYGVIRLDRILPHQITPLFDRPPEAKPVPASNVVTFPGAGKALSVEDQEAFTALGAELRDQVGPTSLPEPPPSVAAQDASAVAPVAAPPPAPVAIVPLQPETIPLPSPAPEAAVRSTPHHDRVAEVGSNGLAVLDRLAVALLVSRDNVPIFANRHMLDLTGFADEDGLHAAGGLAHLFGDLPGNASGSEAVGIRGRAGNIIRAIARMQRIEWGGLPATLLTLQPSREAVAPTTAPVAENIPPPVKSESVELKELRSILETATDGVVVIDGACNVLSLNRSGEALLGCDRGEVIGKPFLGLFAPHNLGLASDYFEGLKSSATQSLLNDGREILIQARQGVTIPVFMTLGRLTHAHADEPLDAARFCALFRDLTPWKKVEQELEGARNEAERASALKSEFLTKVSHEVRTPLNAIIGFAETMVEERFGPLGARYKEYVRDIHTSGTYVLSLVNDLLDLSKIEAGKMELAVDPIDVNRVVSECVSMMQPQANRERIIMRLSLAPNLPQIKADDRSLHQIVLNVLSNAVKFNEPGGQVIVATAVAESGSVVIRIRDTGPGMSESDIAVALQPFRQLSHVKSAEGGTGLGLPLTKALVEANEATMRIRSKVGQGTLIEVSFPPSRVLGAADLPGAASGDGKL